jgi:hypothetical protein
MNCRHVIGLMSSYMDDTLPADATRAVKFHIGTCDDCYAEYVIWKESAQFFQATTMQEVSAYEPFQQSSVMQDVMTRIGKEDKWSFPMTTSVFQLSSAAKKWITTVCVLLLFVFGVVMFGAIEPDQTFTMTKEIKPQEWTAEAIVMSIDQMKAIPSNQDHISDIRHRVVASIGEPIIFPSTATSMPNFGLILAFFGILVTVVSMNWFSRTN